MSIRSPNPWGAENCRGCHLLLGALSSGRDGGLWFLKPSMTCGVRVLPDLPLLMDEIAAHAAMSSGRQNQKCKWQKCPLTLSSFADAAPNLSSI